ncbi:Outer membrane protein OmpA [Parapedobacter luteus]|uniref:Outer membrane protein OmpA n=1 Tax=Parapedobacter luteus TaxID=623280 RepID=A0A1T5C7D6_9SPHI|nr:OmpA family protein [Parapedobacter luteus]SKB55492.1 Outer membrane protein OmpA [Parapedobacter luteus]
MKRYSIFTFVFIISAAVFSCKNKQMAVNPGAQVTVDGTQDGLKHVQSNFEDAAMTDRGIMVTFDADVLFPLNSSYLTDQAKNELDKLVALLNDYPGATLIVDGHTDATGTETYNQWLSEKRAESVKKYAVEKGLDETRITTNGYGQSKPVAPNNTKEGRQRNRRVEVTIVTAKR